MRYFLGIVGDFLGETKRNIQIQHTFEFGEPGINNDLDSVLFRPLRNLAEEGKPIGYYQYIFYHNRQNLHNCNKKFFTFGSFVYTMGKKILFFPGILGKHLTIYNKDGNIKCKKENLQKIDHFSLEPLRNRWHITYYNNEGQKIHERNKNVMKIDENFIHWFSMSVGDINKFETLKINNEINYSCSESDAERRVKEHSIASNNAKHNIIEALDARVVDTPCFIHLDIFVRKEKNKNFSTPVVCFAEQSLLGDKGLLPKQDIPIRSHQIQLEGFEGDIIVGATIMSGPLSDELTITFKA